MVTRDGFVKILDFGLAKLLRPEAGAVADQSSTATGTIVGTAGYLSPEQLRGQTADARSDIFSLGIVLYEMVTGENPFRRENAADTFSAILRDDPPPLSEKGIAVPPALATVIQRALAKRPEERFGSSRELGVELKRIRAALESGVSATRVAPTVPAARPRRRRLLRVVAGAAVLAVVGAVILSRRRPGLPRPVSLPPNQLAVAVLPITNSSGDAELERAGIGKILGDALVQVLWDVPSLYVISPVRLESVSRSLGEPIARAAADPALARRVSEKSGASAMLTGSLARVGGTYVLTANLTELASERLLGSFRGVAADRDRLLTDLVEQVASGVRRQIAPEAPAEGLDRVATSDFRAYEHYVRGMEQNITGNWKAAIPELEQAIALDPRMGLAWSELACSYSFAGEDPKAEAAQKKAEEFLARVNRKERLWIEANGVWVRTRSPQAFKKVYQKFIDEFPDDRQGYFYMGLAEDYLGGNCKAALSWYEKAYALSPAYYPITNAMVDCHLKLEQEGQAAASLRRYLKLPSLDTHGRERAQWRLGDLSKKAA
jgi:tetratricopeptide (TPR) repeat protein